MSVEHRCAGREFQTVGAATGNLRRPSSVLVRGTSMSRRSAERRCARPEMSEAGVQTCLKYAGPVPRIQSKAVAATFIRSAVKVKITGAKKRICPVRGWSFSIEMKGNQKSCCVCCRVWQLPWDLRFLSDRVAVRVLHLWRRTHYYQWCCCCCRAAWHYHSWCKSSLVAFLCQPNHCTHGGRNIY